MAHGTGNRRREGLREVEGRLDKEEETKKKRKKQKKKKKKRRMKKKKKKGADLAAIYTRNGADRGKTPQFCCSILQTYI